MGKLIILGLGPDKPGCLTLGAVSLFEKGKLVLRTARHAAADYLNEKNIPFTALDDLYEHSADFETLYERIFQTLQDLCQKSDVLYGVPGSGDGSDQSVLYLQAHFKGEIAVVPGMGLSAPVSCQALKEGWSAPFLLQVFTGDLGQFPLSSSLNLCVQELDSFVKAAECKLVLSEYYGDNHLVGWFNGDKLTPLPLHEIDRQNPYTHRCALFVPALSEMAAGRFSFEGLLHIMARLRGENGCPWDKEQTHDSLRSSLLEESYEVLQALCDGDMTALCEELGDLLLQVVFHAQIAQEHGEFNSRDIITAICEKLIRRHPHIFGDVKVDSTLDVIRNWGEIKKQEKQITTLYEQLQDVPMSMPALMRCGKIQNRAAKVGIDIPLSEAFSLLAKTLDRLALQKTEADCGKALFLLTAICRHFNVQGELALQKSMQHFIEKTKDTTPLSQDLYNC